MRDAFNESLADVRRRLLEMVNLVQVAVNDATESLLEADGEKAEQVIDARSAARFAGTEPEPREGMRAGHIPGSRNLPFNNLFNADGTWKQGDALRAEFDAAGVDLKKATVATCGSGITAAVLAFGAAILGEKKVAIYDGSWSEWGASASAPVVTGAA